MSEALGLGFSWDLRGDTVCLRRNGYVVAVLRGEKAIAFLAEADRATEEDIEQFLERLTG